MREKWSNSRALLARAGGSLTGGVSSQFRRKSPVPLYFTDGYGCRLRDVDGNEYIDYALAWGPNILGYRHPQVVKALREVVEGPHTYGAQHELEFLVAEKIQQVVPCAERVAFSSSGSEAVQLVLRLARAFTNRNLIVKFEGHYHGWFDTILLSYHPGQEEIGPRNTPHAVFVSRGQVPNSADYVLVRPWNDAALLEETFREKGDQIAAVIMEPVLCNSGCILPAPGYLEHVKAICARYGALLILDEVITGFRIHLRGAQGLYGVTPDLATFGKAIAGGAPLSVVAGRREIMEQMVEGGVTFAGTFNGNLISLAAAHATLNELSRDDGAPVVRANQLGLKLMEGIRALARARGFTLLVTGLGAAFAIHFTTRTELRDYRDTFDDDRERLSSFLLSALAEGVYLLPDGRFYISVAHTEQDVEETLERLDRAFQNLK